MPSDPDVKGVGGGVWDIRCSVCGEWWTFEKNDTDIIIGVVELWNRKQRTCPDCCDLEDLRQPWELRHE